MVVSRTVLVAGAVALAVCLVSIGFLLGRESARRQAGAAHGNPAAAPSEARPPSSPSGWTEFPPLHPAPEAGAAPVLPDLFPAAGGEREAVARYFATVESIEARAKTWTDPMALAQSLLSQAVDGDASAFDGLIAAQRAARRDLEALTPPEPCRPHLHRTIELLDEATALLQGLRDRILGGDLEGLAGFAAQAQSLEARAREVDTLAAGIKKRFGL